IEFNVAANQRETETRALMAACGFLTFLREGLEEARQINRVDTIAGVAHLKREHARAIAKDAHRYGAFFGEFDRVLEQVDDGVRQAMFVENYRRVRGVNLAVEPEAFLAREHVQVLDVALDHRI